ncbi:unnamed protein product [Acanthoscelides obtectus]|uniref:ZAD domain-containing protein n=1 Tax=Acanthoscelides obtectus TaxID=200917 RepID=A0A9P0KH15_ACAOB|nr:unnamed protein product [Acanthoscelides obtectus]CAK1620660.1 hypothetical protein AOBTE_LOCUS496 [Acanthoscelides obtectus]
MNLQSYPHKLCRLCLTPSPVQRPLANTDECMMLEALTGIEVTKEDTIPQKACIKCLLNLKLAFQIQQKFLHSYKWLTEHLSEMGDTKPDITSTLCMSKGISKEADVDIANKSEDGPTNEKDVCDVKVEDESSCEADPSKNEQLEKTEGVVDSANEAISRYDMIGSNNLLQGVQSFLQL